MSNKDSKPVKDGELTDKQLDGIAGGQGAVIRCRSGDLLPGDHQIAVAVDGQPVPPIDHRGRGRLLDDHRSAKHRNAPAGYRRGAVQSHLGVGVGVPGVVEHYAQRHVEVLAVVVILGLLATVLTAGISGKMGKARHELARTQIAQLVAQGIWGWEFISRETSSPVPQ